MKEKEYHKSRRMFFVIDDVLIIAGKGLNNSHSEWLKSKGWSNKKIKEFIDSELRGVLNPDGKIRFYTGKNFEVNKKIEKIFFKHLPCLVNKLNISLEAEIGGGTIVQEIGKFWPERKKYGKVENFIKK
jgi:hypothetical protein